jgi:hypothetical protein
MSHRQQKRYRPATSGYQGQEIEMFAAYDDQAIWGTGETPEQAIADCTQWVNAEDAEELAASVKTAVMTDELAALVAVRGGNIGFELLSDGKIGLAVD